MKGKIYIVGIGPGDKEYIAPKAYFAIKKSDYIIGYKRYIDLIKDLIKEKKVLTGGMGEEIKRAKIAIENAKKGNTVAVVSSGDSGIYGMAGLILELLKNKNIEIEIIPGISAFLSSAASLGAPIMHDFVVISLSDLLTDWKIILNRLKYAAKGDFVIVLYNPKSKARENQLKETIDLLLKYKKPDTPAGIVRNSKRDKEEVIITTLGKIPNHNIDMLTTIIIGNSQTYIKDKFIITPRGYKL